MSGALREGNMVRLLETGAEFFPALVAAIHGARHEIMLETYIFERDETGVRVAGALRAAARRGVQVRVLVDGFGGRDFANDMALELQADGVEVLIYRRELKAFSVRRHRLRRLHRKLALVDGRIAFVGGINIIDDMHTPGHVPPRFDFAVAVQGPIVVDVYRSMSLLWRLARWASFRQRPREPRRVIPLRKKAGKMRAAFVVRDNFRHRVDIENAYLRALAEARVEATIASAYFFPGRRFRRALVEAAQRGVKVTLVLQGKVEYWLLHHACKVLYPHLLAAGIRIVEYHKGFLHAKVAVIDDDWATVGSSNIDPFSLLVAREANVVVRDRAFTALLRTRLEQAISSGGVELQQYDWLRRPLLGRLLDWTAYGCVRLMLGLMGFGRHH